MLEDFENLNPSPAAPFLGTAWRIVLLACLWLIVLQTTAAQKIPNDGVKIPLGTDVTAPCSCEGNLCSLWPPPQSGTFPKGFETKEKKITSFIEKGQMIEGQWVKEKGVGGAAVTEQSKGGKCIKVNGGGGWTEEPAPAIFSITYPGTYRLHIDRFDWLAIYDCRNPTCSFSNPHVLKSEATFEDRYFYVEPEPVKGCKNATLNRINQVTECRAGNCVDNVLDDEARLSLGLGAPLFMRGQTVRVPKNVQAIQIEFEDGSIMRLTGGTVVKINDCNEFVDTPVPVKVKIGLILGHIWYKVSKAVGGGTEREVNTDRCVNGVRGTTFSVTYDSKSETTTVEVEEGSVWMRNKFGTPQTIIVDAGQTGAQVGSHPPRLKR